MCRLCANLAGRRGLTATSIGGQGTVAQAEQDPFAFSAEAGAAGGAEKRVPTAAGERGRKSARARGEDEAAQDTVTEEEIPFPVRSFSIHSFEH